VNIKNAKNDDVKRITLTQTPTRLGLTLFDQKKKKKKKKKKNYKKKNPKKKKKKK